jgi:hypothetical protein
MDIPVRNHPNTALLFVIVVFAMSFAMMVICPMVMNAWWIVTIVKMREYINVQKKVISVQNLSAIRSISGNGIKHANPIRVMEMYAVSAQTVKNTVSTERRRLAAMAHG